MTQRGELPPRRLPFAYDNGAFRDWRAGRPFDAEAYERDLVFIEEHDVRPDFMMAPDIVAGGASSLEFSLSWLPRLERLGLPVYLVVQDGMTPATVWRHLPRFAGIFVGGSTDWKARTAEGWVHFAHLLGLPCHIGRVGSARKVRWARAIGADSIDSSLPLFSEGNMDVFVGAVERAEQPGLFPAPEDVWKL